MPEITGAITEWCPNQIEQICEYNNIDCDEYPTIIPTSLQKYGCPSSALDQFIQEGALALILGDPHKIASNIENCPQFLLWFLLSPASNNTPMQEKGKNLVIGLNIHSELDINIFNKTKQDITHLPPIQQQALLTTAQINTIDDASKISKPIHIDALNLGIFPDFAKEFNYSYQIEAFKNISSMPPFIAHMFIALQLKEKYSDTFWNKINSYNATLNEQDFISCKYDQSSEQVCTYRTHKPKTSTKTTAQLSYFDIAMSSIPYVIILIMIPKNLYSAYKYLHP
ncbi:MAG: hypothetical protein HRU36_06075 [Rickettsiales bacterium]|nr:hypothetical protein [Rickettsiales bacterium]